MRLEVLRMGLGLTIASLLLASITQAASPLPQPSPPPPGNQKLTAEKLNPMIALMKKVPGALQEVVNNIVTLAQEFPSDQVKVTDTAQKTEITLYPQALSQILQLLQQQGNPAGARVQDFLDHFKQMELVYYKHHDERLELHLSFNSYYRIDFDQNATHTGLIAAANLPAATDATSATSVQPAQNLAVIPTHAAGQKATFDRVYFAKEMGYAWRVDGTQFKFAALGRNHNDGMRIHLAGLPKPVSNVVLREFNLDLANPNDIKGEIKAGVGGWLANLVIVPEQLEIKATTPAIAGTMPTQFQFDSKIDLGGLLKDNTKLLILGPALLFLAL